MRNLEICTGAGYELQKFAGFISTQLQNVKQIS